MNKTGNSLLNSEKKIDIYYDIILRHYCLSHTTVTFTFICMNWGQTGTLLLTVLHYWNKLQNCLKLKKLVLLRDFKVLLADILHNV